MDEAEILWYIIKMEIQLSGHGAYRTGYHIIWIPKYRRRILNYGIRGYLIKLFPKVHRSMTGCEIIKKNIQIDHIHLLMVIPPKYAVSDGVSRIKGIIARQLRKKFDWLQKVYWKEKLVWFPGYFVSTVGVDEEKVIKYIRWQQNQDSGQAELVFFKCHGIGRGYLNDVFVKGGVSSV